jgi:hypothetical protein
VSDLWSAGLSDVRRLLTDPEWLRVTELGAGLRVYDLVK